MSIDSRLVLGSLNLNENSMKETTSSLGLTCMKTKTLIKTWLTGLRKGRGFQKLACLCNGLADAQAYALAINEIPLAQPKRLVPIQMHPAVEFKPRLNFRRPSLDSLEASGALKRIQLVVRSRRCVRV